MTEMIEKWKYDLSDIIHQKNREIKELALEKAVRAICTGNDNDFEACLLEIIKTLGGQEAISFIEKNKQLAYFIYCQGQ